MIHSQTEVTKHGEGESVSIFTTRPSLGFAAGQAVSSNGVLTATPLSIAAGSILRLDIISVQTGMRGFDVVLGYQPT